ncbi:hypothetical protein [Candidatus Finniella inopinata]|uniref:Uncharacterized protein n=1 Tax=Candidatus Finniella inopinata TaxID=1696036 RepID=A0A4Q7DK18_9PROT|nr:hypothetical protein [Candidatus Finniella inopinata]RZI46525.1 hypothetical protein EQU50_02765 [Candidatus Finniella inopinata]
MSSEIETPKEDLNKDPLPKKPEKFWQKRCFFYQLLMQGTVSLFLIFCTVAIVFCTSFWWENALFPGLRKIDPLQRDLTIVQAKVDQVDQTIQRMNDRGAEIDMLKNQLITLQQAIAALEKEGVKPSTTQAQVAGERSLPEVSYELKGMWDQFKNRLQQGEVCIELFTEFKTKLPSNVSMPEHIQKLEGFAQTPAKSMVFLRDQLEKIYQTIKASPLASEKVTIPEHHGWLAAVWKYLSKWIKVQPLDNKGEQVSVTAALEKAVKAMENNQLARTIEFLKSLPSEESVGEWLNQAEQRQRCEIVINEVGKLVGQTVKG